MLFVDQGKTLSKVAETMKTHGLHARLVAELLRTALYSAKLMRLERIAIRTPTQDMEHTKEPHKRRMASHQSRSGGEASPGKGKCCLNQRC